MLTRLGALILGGEPLVFVFSLEQIVYLGHLNDNQ